MIAKDPRTDADMRSVISDYEYETPVDANGNPIDCVKIKWLGRDAKHKGCYTRILILEPGFDSSKMDFEYGFGKHDYYKEDLILEGHLYDCGEQTLYTKGYYGLFAPNSDHGPYKTDLGCKILETTWYDAAWYRSKL